MRKTLQLIFNKIEWSLLWFGKLRGVPTHWRMANSE